MDDTPISLVLQLIEGPELGGMDRAWRTRPERALVIGRGQDADVRLPDASVSRRHAEVSFDGVAWALHDLGSRHGCVVAGRLVRPCEQVTLGHLNEIQIGAWVFRVQLTGGMTSAVTVSPESTQHDRVRRVSPDEIGTLIKRRLEVVLASAGTLGNAATESEAAHLIAESVARGVLHAQVAVVATSPSGEPGDVLASAGNTGDFELSRSLLTEAARGETVVLEANTQTHNYGVSIAQLGIRSACCAPITVGDRIEALLYLDARADDPGADAGEDAASFVHAMARICGLAMSNIRRASLEISRVQIESDLRAARVAQRIMMPDSRGVTHGVEYAMLNRPGRFVAGDLIGVEQRSNGRVCFYLGDVTGKGVGAAMLMGIAQSSLHASLAADAPIEDAGMRLNRLLAPRIEAGQFISLWIGEYDHTTRELKSTDCGHGYSLLRESRQIAAGIGAGSFPIGIDPEQVLTTESRTIEPGASLLLFSDGLAEQPSPEGEQFGFERIRPIAESTHEPGLLVDRLVEELTRFGNTEAFDDDLTIAAFRFV
ncbi:MAG: SpoIIE family protein phosphatase [Planctomycetota bacterium]